MPTSARDATSRARPSTPIGPKARHLNREFAYAIGSREPACSLEPRWGTRGRTGARRCASACPPGTIPQAAAWTPAPAPGSRSIVPIATTPRARAKLGTRSAGVAKEPDCLRHLQGPRGCGPRLGRARVRHRPRPARQVHSGLPDRLDRRRHHDARTGQAADPRGRPGPDPGVDRGDGRPGKPGTTAPRLDGPARASASSHGLHNGSWIERRRRNRRRSILHTFSEDLEGTGREPRRGGGRSSFPGSRDVGAIVQIHGDHEFALRNAPRDYVWQTSQDGMTWEDLKETATDDERRTFRIHRLRSEPTGPMAEARSIASAEGDAPASARGRVLWRPASRRSRFLPGRSWSAQPAQARFPARGAPRFIAWPGPLRAGVSSSFRTSGWVISTSEFIAIEPRPLCAFLSGNFIDWCQQNRDHWRGTAAILRDWKPADLGLVRRGSGAGDPCRDRVDRPWDCPQCRDPEDPQLPIYTHIARLRPAQVRRLLRLCLRAWAVHDPAAFSRPGLPSVCLTEFRAMESHCGQIEWAPEGLGADRHLRGRRQDEDPVPPAQGPPGLRCSVPHRDGGYPGIVQADHGELPRPEPRSEAEPGSRVIVKNRLSGLPRPERCLRSESSANPGPQRFSRGRESCTRQGGDPAVPARRSRSCARALARKCSRARAMSPDRR